VSANEVDMKAVEMASPGGPSVLIERRRQRPQPAAGEVLIHVAAAGVNGPDLMQRKGLYPAPPGASDLLGLEVSGTIVDVGEGVQRGSMSDQVTALTNGGGYAEYVTVDARHCLPIPRRMTLRDAAGIPEIFFTVWSNIFMAAAAGETLLVHGGAGGIGTTALHWARRWALQSSRPTALRNDVDNVWNSAPIGRLTTERRISSKSYESMAGPTLYLTLSAARTSSET
jgi:NADPH2:quinone reductase